MGSHSFHLPNSGILQTSMDWSAKYLKFEGENFEIRILSHSIQQTYALRKVKKQVLLFLSSWE